MTRKHRNAVVLVLVIALAGALFFFITRDDEVIKNINSNGTTIVAFGDSLVEGVGASDGNDFVTLLSERVGEPIINLGVSGNTSAQALLRIDEVLEHDPKVVLVLIGGNDYLRQVPKSTLFLNLRQIVTRIQNSGSAVIVLGVRGGLLRDNFDSDYRDLARELEAGYVPNVLDGIIGKPDLLSDSIHPNDVGYIRIADKVEPVLRRVLTAK
ncbi:MAG: GDSL-type esterase/lipase family protein [Candidatus Paceibacterota bacterium]